MFFIMVLNNTYLNQLVKLPLLVQHFVEHQQRDSRVSLLDFLSMHYWGEDIDDDDTDKDIALPFKTIEQNITIGFYLPQQKVFTLIPVARSQRTHYPICKFSGLVAPYLSALFRPPKGF